MLLFYCDRPSSRLQYILNWICDQWGINYTLTQDTSHFSESGLPKIWYSKHKPADSDKALWVGSSGLLYERGISTPEIEVTRSESCVRLFPAEGTLGFDIFSALFFMISRYEEYLPFTADKHGRFPASQSLAFRNGFLEYPIGDIWLNELRGGLSNLYPELIFREERFRTVFSYDIDVAFKFQGRSVSSHLKGIAADFFRLRLKNLYDRIAVLLQMKKDPWDVYDFIRQATEGPDIPALFFFQSGKRTRFDRNLSVRNPAVRKLLKKVDDFGRVGLHPSYYSSEDELKLTFEKTKLETAVRGRITESRQHFLRFRLPETYRALENVGIAHDYSMAFPDAPGFRAGTSKPFYFYDLKNEKATELKVFPACWMDATFINYMKTDVSAALEKAISLINRVREVNGLFIPIFHNDHLSREEMKSLHTAMVDEVKKAPEA